MRDTRSILLLIVSFLLLVVSCALLWTWAFRVYRSDQAREASLPPAKSNAVTVTIPLKDSAALDESQLKELDSVWNNVGQLKGQLNDKLDEFNRLRAEITQLVKMPASNADIASARQKIIALQQIIEELRNRNKDVENENKRLQGVLQQLSAYMKNPGQNIRRVGYEEKQNNTETVSSNAASQAALMASELKLSAISTNNDKEEETTDAGLTDKFVGTILVRNNNSNANNEMIIVITKPDGQVLKGSPWESGVFSTPEGKRVYSYKMNFDLSKGESRRLLFSLPADRLQKGNYSMQVYHNGVMIAKLNKTLS